jgi:hypothetical protein
MCPERVWMPPPWLMTTGCVGGVKPLRHHGALAAAMIDVPLAGNVDAGVLVVNAVTGARRRNRRKS